MGTYVFQQPIRELKTRILVENIEDAIFFFLGGGGGMSIQEPVSELDTRIPVERRFNQSFENFLMKVQAHILNLLPNHLPLMSNFCLLSMKCF